MTFLPDHMLGRVRKALEAELARLQGPPALRRSLVRIRLPAPAPEPVPRLAVVATDAGNLELRLHPLRVGLVRVATSDPRLPVGEVYVPLSATTEDQVRWVFAEPGMASLRAAAARCGLDPATPGAWLPRDLASPYGLDFLRELLEWLLLVHVAGTAAAGTMLLRDGLLRSVALPRAAFAPIGRALRDLTGERRLLLCALAKRAPGGPDFMSYLELALAAPPGAGTDHGALEVPPEVEERFSPHAYASLRGRRLGILFLLEPRGARTRRPLAVEVPLWQRDRAPEVLAALLHHGRGGYPEPGHPPELLQAHLAARVSPIQRQALARAFLRRLAGERPDLQRRLLEAHLTQGAVAIEPAGEEDAG